MYLLSYFRPSDDSHAREEAESLFLAVSADGLKYRALNNERAVFVSPFSGITIRDPFLAREVNGTFHLISTATTENWEGQTLFHASSPDGIAWTPELIPVMQSVPDARNCWAPEAFYDAHENVWRLIWATSLERIDNLADWNHRIWSCSTRDWKTFSAPHIFFDPGHSVIDASVAVRDGKFWLSYKDERGENQADLQGKYIYLRSAACIKPDGRTSWSKASPPISPALSEGPSLFFRGDRWTMIFDRFFHGGYGAVQSSDGQSWRDISELLELPRDVRHASVLQMDEASAQRLIDHYGF